jgi:hypothetical protein
MSIHAMSGEGYRGGKAAKATSHDGDPQRTVHG